MRLAIDGDDAAITGVADIEGVGQRRPVHGDRSRASGEGIDQRQGGDVDDADGAGLAIGEVGVAAVRAEGYGQRPAVGVDDRDPT